MGRTMVAVDVERWVEGTLTGGFRKRGESVDAVREFYCPKEDGWIHYVDEGQLSARKHGTEYLFRLVAD